MTTDGTCTPNASNSSTPSTNTASECKSYEYSEGTVSSNTLQSAESAAATPCGGGGLLSGLFGKSTEEKKGKENERRLKSNSGVNVIGYGPGSIILTRAEMTLHEVQCHLNEEGASNLVVELIMSNPSHSIFVESVELGIALLEGGNSTIQKSIYQKLTNGNNSEKFFKVFYDKMKFAQQEIKSTISVNSSDFYKGLSSSR